MEHYYILDHAYDLSEGKSYPIIKIPQNFERIEGILKELNIDYRKSGVSCYKSRNHFIMDNTPDNLEKVKIAVAKYHEIRLQETLKQLKPLDDKGIYWEREQDLQEMKKETEAFPVPETFLLIDRPVFRFKNRTLGYIDISKLDIKADQTRIFLTPHTTWCDYIGKGGCHVHLAERDLSNMLGREVTIIYKRKNKEQ